MKKTTKLVSLLLVLVLVFSLLAGCGSSSSDDESSVADEEETVAEETISDEEESAESDTSDAEDEEDESDESEESESGTRTIIDYAGYEVEIPEVVDTVYNQLSAFDAIVIMLGRQDALVGTAEDICNEWIARVFPEVYDLPLPTVDYDTGNLEELMSLGVEVVLCTEANRDVLLNAGFIPVVINGSSTESIQFAVEILGEILGEEERSNEILEYWNNNIDYVTSITDDLSDDERPTVFYAARNILNTEGSDSIVTEWIEMAGGVNVAAENGVTGMFVDVTEEELMSWDPDIIVCRDYSQMEDYYSSEALSDLSAVKNEQIYVAPKSIFTWCIRSAEEAIQVLWAATIIHPELFEDIDMAEETREFHSLFYGMELTDEDVETILAGTTDIKHST